MVRLLILHDRIMLEVLIRILYSQSTFCSSGCAGGHVEACQRLQGHLRLVGAGDAAGSVHHGTNYLLELSENQQSHHQHHIDGDGTRVKVGQVIKKLVLRVDDEKGG